MHYKARTYSVHRPGVYIIRTDPYDGRPRYGRGTAEVRPRYGKFRTTDEAHPYDGRRKYGHIPYVRYGSPPSICAEVLERIRAAS